MHLGGSFGGGGFGGGGFGGGLDRGGFVGGLAAFGDARRRLGGISGGPGFGLARGCALGRTRSCRCVLGGINGCGDVAFALPRSCVLDGARRRVRGLGGFSGGYAAVAVAGGCAFGGVLVLWLARGVGRGRRLGLARCFEAAVALRCGGGLDRGFGLALRFGHAFRLARGLGVLGLGLAFGLGCEVGVALGLGLGFGAGLGAGLGLCGLLDDFGSGSSRVLAVAFGGWAALGRLVSRRDG